jgi:hypothetical protein
VENLQGRVFGRWTVIGPPERRDGAIWSPCRCECGTARDVRGYTLTGGKSHSCGCLIGEASVRTRTTHGMATKDGRAPEYQVWAGMKNRCSDPTSDRWHRYGGRGIRVCDRWWNSFESFYADMGPRPGPDYQIDREDNDGNYEPGNCRWVTRVVNANNREASRIIEFGGRSLTITQWARETGLARQALETRLDAGWTVERALTEPSGALHGLTVMLEHDGQTLPLQQWAKLVGVAGTTIHNRLRAGWSVERALTTPADRVRRIEWNGESRTVAEWSKVLGISKGVLHARLGQMGWPVEKAFTTPVKAA